MLTISLISLLIAVPLFSYQISPSLFNRITTISLIFSAYLSFNSIEIFKIIDSDIIMYNGFFHVTNVTQSMETFLLIIGGIVLISWANFPTTISHYNTEVPTISEYSLLILFTTIGASLLVSSSDIVSMFLSIELQSFAVYVLATLYRNSESATAAGLKYFLLGGLSSALILLGTALIYSNTGLTHFDSIHTLLSVQETYSVMPYWVSGVQLGIVLIGVGFLFKIAAAPFHNWAPDVYDGTPTIVTLWLSTMPKISIFVLLLNFSINQGLEFGESWRSLLMLGSIFSLILGTVLGLSQYKIKRLLTYSTISHVGFLLLALSMNTEESVESFIFYLIQYTITNLNVFMVLLGLGYIISNSSYNKTSNLNFGSKKVDIEFVDQLKGQFSQNPFLSTSFATCLFSIAGIPPLIGFFAKQMVLYSSINESSAGFIGYYFISIVAILVSVISAFYYLKIIQVMYFSNIVTNEMQSTNEEFKASPISNIHSIIIASLTMIIILFIFQPIILLNSCHLLALSLFYY